jgi:hypothetical protein
MACLHLAQYRESIRSMPIMDQASVSKLTTWSGCRNTDLDAVFKRFAEAGGMTVSISRRDIFRLASARLTSQFLYATYIWGYPNGNRGRYKEVFEQVDEILRHLSRVPGRINEADWCSVYRELTRGISGVNVSTWTKLLHFLRIRIGRWPALILDRKIVDVFTRCAFCEFSELAGISYANGPRHYVDYLRSMYDAAAKLEVDADKLEMFLFMFGNGLKNGKDPRSTG